MFKKMFISMTDLAITTIAGPMLVIGNNSLTIKTVDDKEDLKVNNVYFLGDDFYENGVYTKSLTDVLKKIKIYRTIVPTIPKAKTLSLPSHYYNDSFSNGPVISELLAKKFDVPISPAWDLRWNWKVLAVNTTVTTSNLGNNYAFAGATSYYDDSEYEKNQSSFLKNVFPRCNRNFNFIKEALPLLTSKFSLNYQTDALIRQHETLKDNDILLIQIGVNDIKNLVSRIEKNPTYDVDQYLENSVNNLKQSVEKLISKNAKKIIVNNVFDLTKTPMYSKKNEETLNTIAGYVNAYNTKLKSMIDGINSSQFGKIKLFDFYQEFNGIIEQFSEAQFNIRQQALNSVEYEKVLLEMFTENANQKVDVSEVERFLFLDDIHLTKISHEIVSEKIFSLIQNW